MERIADGEDDERVLMMIGAAVMAGAYRAAAGEMPAARRGWLRMARLHSLRVGALADEIAAATPYGIGAAAQALGATEQTCGDTGLEA